MPVPAIWIPRSGLVDDYDLWITKAEFSYRLKYIDRKSGEQVPLLILAGESPDTDLPDDHEERISIGKKWLVSEDGLTVTVEDPRARYFTEGSKYAMFLDSLVKCGGKEFERFSEQMEKSGLGPDFAKTWIGVGLHLKRFKHDYGEIDGEQVGEKDILLPTAFLGTRQQGRVAATATIKVTRPGGRPANRPAAAADQATADKLAAKKAELAARKANGAADNPLVAELTELALEHSDVLDFQQRAMAIESLNLPENEALMEDVLTDDGFWARARQ